MLTVTVTSPPRHGKTFLLGLIGKFLQEQGYQVSLVNTENSPVDLDRLIESIEKVNVDTGRYVTLIERDSTGKPWTFLSELENLINRYSQEGASNTPDFILAKHLQGCLSLYNSTVSERDTWLGYDSLNKPQREITKTLSRENGPPQTVTPLNEKQQKTYEESGEKELAQKAYESVVQGTFVEVNYKPWGGKVRLIGASIYPHRVSTMTGTGIFFRFEPLQETLHRADGTLESHAINFDFGKNPWPLD
jgi:hypothetical protein